MGSGQRKAADEALGKQGAVVEEQMALSKNLASESAPWRAIAGKYYTDIAKGGDALTKAVAPQTNAATIQYQTALQKIKGMPLGGARDRAMREVRLGEAGTKAGIYSGGVNDAVGKIAAMGAQGTGAAMSGYSNAGSGYANVAQSYSDMAQGKGAAMGGLAGAGGGIAAAAIAA